MKYGELTLEQIEAIIDKLGGLTGVRRFLAGEITVSASQITFSVTLDYRRSLAEMIQAGHYDWVSPEITADHFSVSGEGCHQRTIALLNFNRQLTSEQIIAKLDEEGFRPAKIEELLALGEAQPQLQKKFTIIALGSCWVDLSGEQLVPCLHGDDNSRILCLEAFARTWYADYYFAAVCKWAL